MPRHPLSPPANVNMAERTLLGLDYRKIFIFALTLLPALGVMLGWREGPLAVRIALGVFIALLGVALAFGQVNGKTPERWLLDGLSYRSRKRLRLHSKLRGQTDDRSARLETGLAPAAAPARAIALRRPDFFILTADAIGLSMLGCLTGWLYNGGAHDLARWWHSVAGTL